MIDKEIKEALINVIGEKDANILIERIKNEKSKEFIRIFIDAIYDTFGYQQGRKIVIALAYNLQKKNSPYSRMLLGWLK
ncbi:MAG: hypothetical protein QW272_05115 [Candidatus Methanomethylicaceae archaeon]